MQQKLLAGDSMLLVGHEQMIDQLREERGLLLLETRPVPIVARAKAYWTLGLLACVVLASAVRLLQPAVAMLFAAAAAVLIGCISLREAYRAIDWRTIVVLGGMIPFGLALEKTGAAELLAETTVGSLQGFGPHALFAALLLLTVLFTQIIENAAAAVILAPIAYELALSSGANPTPFLLGMAICTSAGFSTPWAHESTLLVLGPGRYEMRHYLALGLPFTAITWIVTVVVLPWFVPLVG
jgi:di/tricarboxylate transporter